MWLPKGEKYRNEGGEKYVSPLNHWQSIHMEVEGLTAMAA